MTDQNALDAIHLLSKLSVAFYTAKPALYSLAIAHMVQLCLKQGNTEMMSPFYAAYGFILCSLSDDIDMGFEFAQLSLANLDKSEGQIQKAETLVNATGPWNFKRPIQESISLLSEAMLAGQASGDLHFSCSSTMWSGIYYWFSGLEMNILAQKFEQYDRFIQDLHQNNVLNFHRITYQTIVNLKEPGQQPEILQGKWFNETESLEAYRNSHDRFAVALVYINKLMLSVIFQHNEQAKIYADYAEEYLDGVMGSYFVPAFHFYAALARLSDCEGGIIPKMVSHHMERLRFWADHNPCSFEHKWALMTAEYHRVIGDFLAAEDHYDLAIKGARANGFIQEQGLACELAAQFYLQRGKIKIAELYLSDAYYAYSHWGARTKVEQLTQQCPELLSRILGHTEHSPTGIQADTNTSVNASLDIDTLMKASQSLSGELSVNGLLNDLLVLLLEHAGAQRCLLLLNEDGQWRVAGESHAGDTIHTHLPNLPLLAYNRVPHNLIRTVITRQQHLILDDVTSVSQRFYADPYFQQHPDIKSVLCLPVLSKKRLLGLIYLENDLVTSAFHDKLLRLTTMLAAQAAISLENALLYEHLEEKVRQRTEELEQSKQEAERLARTDSLTGICNRRAFFESGKAELIRAQRYKHCLSVIILDIDHFKAINDTYGHKVGDVAIQALVSVMQSTCRINDIIGRLGGEEFVILLPQTTQEQAEVTAERIRDKLEQQTLRTEHYSLNYTASFGISLFDGHHCDGQRVTLDELLEQADKGMYQAKENGRNQIVFFSENV